MRTDPSGLIWLAYLAVSLLLVALILLRKEKRNIVERGSRKRRVRIAAEIADAHSPLFEIRAAALARGQPRADLLMTLQGLSRDERASLGPRFARMRTDLEDALLDDFHDGPATRARALILMGRLGVGATYDCATQAVRDPDRDVRLAACQALAELASHEAAEALLDVLEQRLVAPERIVEHASEPWALDAVLARLEVGSPAAPGLLRMLELIADVRGRDVARSWLASEDGSARAAAARALGALGDPSDGDALSHALLDPDAGVRAAAAEALARLGSTLAIDELEQAMTDSDWEVRRAAADALASLSWAGESALQRVAAGPDRYASERAVERLQVKHRLEELST